MLHSSFLTQPTVEPKISLLVVEDEALIAENLRLTLEDLGYAVLATCYTFAEAEQAFEQYEPDLVLLDINLGSLDPARSGLTLGQRLSAAGRPFIFLTAYNDFDTIRQATRLRPSGYLIKPVNPAALFAALQTALERTTTATPTTIMALLPLPDPTAEPPDYFFIKHGGQTVKLYWREVASLEAGKNYVTLRLPDLRVNHAIRDSLVSVLDQLLPAALRPQFLRVNRATALNTEFITAYDDEFVYCAGERYENGQGAQQQLQGLGL